jgi:predicted DNA-binding transcriptional regulator AlpA
LPQHLDVGDVCCTPPDESTHQIPPWDTTETEHLTMTRDELATLPALLDVPTAAKVLGIGRSLAYDLVRRGEWPTTVLHIGKLIKIPSAPLLALIGELR